MIGTEGGLGAEAVFGATGLAITGTGFGGGGTDAPRRTFVIERCTGNGGGGGAFFDTAIVLGAGASLMIGTEAGLGAEAGFGATGLALTGAGLGAGADGSPNDGIVTVAFGSGLTGVGVSTLCFGAESFFLSPFKNALNTCGLEEDSLLGFFVGSDASTSNTWGLGMLSFAGLSLTGLSFTRGSFAGDTFFSTFDDFLDIKLRFAFEGNLMAPLLRSDGGVGAAAGGSVASGGVGAEGILSTPNLPFGGEDPLADITGGRGADTCLTGGGDGGETTGGGAGLEGVMTAWWVAGGLNCAMGAGGACTTGAGTGATGTMDGTCSCGTDGGGNAGRGSELAGSKDSKVFGMERSTLSSVSAIAAHSECICPV